MLRLLKYALEKETNRIVGIKDVKNGLRCNCICPLCKENLVAKNNGLNREPHFAHFSEKECKGARMTALHLIAQKIIEEKKAIMLPVYQEAYYKKKAIRISFDKVLLEKTVFGLRPDCIGIKKDSDGEEHNLWIEIKVTHEVDDIKLQKIKALSVPCIEIDLSDLIETDYTIESVSKRLLNEKDDRHWINNPKLDKLNDERKAEHDKKEAERRQKEKEIREREEAERRQKEKEIREREEAKRLQKEKEQLIIEEKAKAEILQKETEWLNKDKILEEKANEWFNNGSHEIAQLIIDKINEESFLQIDPDGTRTPFRVLLSYGDYLYYIDHSPKNEGGLQLFYTLLYYYFDRALSPNSKKIERRLKSFQDRTTPISKEEKIHLEELISLRTVFLLRKENNYTNTIQTYISNPFIRNEVLMVSSVFYHHIVGSESQSFGELTKEIIQHHPHLAHSYLTAINSQDQFKNNFYIGNENMLDVLNKFVNENEPTFNEPVDSILRVCYSFAFRTYANDSMTESTIQEIPLSEIFNQDKTYKQPNEDLKHEKEWNDLNEWYKNYSKTSN